jgi:hypothetical protein
MNDKNILIDYTKWIFKWIFILLIVVVVAIYSYIFYDSYQRQKVDIFALQCSTLEGNKNSYVDSYLLFSKERGSDSPEPTSMIYYYKKFTKELSLRKDIYKKDYKKDNDVYYFASNSYEGTKYQFEINRKSLNVNIYTDNGHKREDENLIRENSCKKTSIDELKIKQKILSTEKFAI